MLGCWQSVRMWLGAVLGSVQELPAAHGMSLRLWKGAREEWEHSGTVVLCPWSSQCQSSCDSGTGSPPGPACPAPATLGPSQAGDGHLDPHSKLGSTGGTQLQPCANKPLITAGLGWGFPPFPVFPAGPTGICVRICDPVAALGSPWTIWGVQGLPQEGLHKVGQISQGAARHPLLSLLFPR